VNNILWSAIVALAVSLATEWFAKPLLEARKERILDQHKAIRRAAAIAIDEYHRMGEYLDTGRHTSKPDHIDELRSLQLYVESVRFRRDREAMRIMINAVLYPGLDPIYPTIPGHPRTEEEDATLAYYAALFVLTPPLRFRRRRQLLGWMQQLLEPPPEDDSDPRRRRTRQDRRRRDTAEPVDAPGPDAAQENVGPS
jgi:hypothetical protein